MQQNKILFIFIPIGHFLCFTFNTDPMQNRKFTFVPFFCLFLLFACQSELELPPEADASELSPFSVHAAQAYFEANAHDLALLRFRDSAIVRTRAGVTMELIPEWDDAIHTIRREVSLVEIPIRSNTLSVFMERNFRDGEFYSSKQIQTFRRLVVARRPDGHTDMFVVTVLPGAAKPGQKTKESIQNFRYLGGEGFNGRVFCSTLDGRFVEAWQYVDGKRYPLQVTTRRHLLEQGDDLSSGEYQALTLSNGIITRSGTYWDNETGGGGGGGGGNGFCQYHPQYAASACPFCLDEVIVRSCQLCGRRLAEGENCYCRCMRCGYSPCRCCFYCHNYPCTCEPGLCPICLQNPCIKCTRCGRHYCYGTCGSSGGGSGEGDAESVGRILANAIFDRSSTLTANQWYKLEKSLENINKDCLGGLLLGASRNKAIKIVHDNNMAANGSYNHSTNTLKIKDFKEAQVTDKQFEKVLFHELLHSQQVYNKEATMNLEIEVWIATYRYAEKYGIRITDPKYGNIRVLALYAIDNKYDITDQSFFDLMYERIVDDFKADSHYQIYQESPGHRNLNTAVRFAKGC